MNETPEDARTKLWEAISSKSYHHVMLLVGSAVSYSEKCECASVSVICNRMVLEPIASWHPGLAKLARSMRYDNTHRDEHATGSLCQAVAALPFEQFMGCIDAVDPGLAATIIKCGCGGSDQSHPNANHEWITSISVELLRSGYCEKVTVATTNYDKCLENTTAFQSLGMRAARKENIFCGSRKLTDRELHYVKLHGCVSDPSTCVFTTEHYANALFDDNLVDKLSSQVGSPDVILAVGYSFSDPDLRPFWEKLYKSGKTSFFWSDRAQEPVEPSAEPPAVLRREFLASLPVTIHRSDLFHLPTPRENNKHILRFLAQRLGLDPQEAPQFGISEARIEDAGNAVSKRSFKAAAEILGRISDSCCQGDAYEALKPLLQCKEEPTPALVRICLDQLGHVGNMGAQATAARELRKQYTQTRVEVVARSIESFALSVGGGIGGTLRAIPVILGVSRTGLRRCDPQTRVFYNHYRAHLFCKIIQKAGCMVPRAVLRGGVRRLFRHLSDLSLSPLRRAISDTEDAIRNQEIKNMLLELKDAASAHHMLSQMLLLSGRFDGATRHADRSQLYYSCSGFVNGALQIDRVFGWLNLATGKRHEAIRILARGLWRALETKDLTLRPKLAADLMRALGAEAVGAIVPGGPDIDERMKETAREAAHNGNIDIQILQEYVGTVYPDEHWELLEKSIRRTLDPNLYPIFLPNDPPVLRH